MQVDRMSSRVAVISFLIVAGIAMSALLLAPAKAFHPAAEGSEPVRPQGLDQNIARYVVDVLDAIPHDSESHTQGLIFHEGFLYESEGKTYDPPDGGPTEIRSSIRRLHPTSGEVLQRADRNDVWNEGLARVGDRLVHMSYKAQKAFFYDLSSFEEVASYDYEQLEGWGLCHDGKRLIMSDGTPNLYFRDPSDFSPMGVISITYQGAPFWKVNELECVGGMVYANVFPGSGHFSDQGLIVEIDPRTGEVVGEIDARGLLTPEEQALASDMNGIAWDPDLSVFYLTGKLWPTMFKVRLITPAADTATPTLAPPSPTSDEPPTVTATPTPTPVPAERWSVEVLGELPHDDTIYTQGLLLHEGTLYESAGNPKGIGPERPSSLRAVEPRSGDQLRIAELDDVFYGEGLALADDRLFWITWRDQRAFVFDRDTFERTQTFRYDGDGWGLCYNGESLVMSDGSDQLTFRDPRTFGVERRVEVKDEGSPVFALNELECVGDHVFANVWKTEEIVRIDAETGRVSAIIDASGLRPETATLSEAVLNGIAHDDATGNFLITGKWWDTLYEVRFVPEGGPKGPGPIYLPWLQKP